MQARQTHLDALKALGALLIVLHHLSAYGPLADAAYRTAPALADWLYEDARMAVQLFLVLGGYLAMQGLQQLVAGSVADLGRLVLRRYLRLVLPLLAALTLAVASAALARHVLQAEFIPAAPDWGQALAHALLLQNVVGAEALSAGVWYVAIDLQLYTLLAMLLWLGRRHVGPAWILVLALMLVSLLYFNRHENWDIWGIYFFGSYAMGALAWRASHSRRPAFGLALLAVAGALALLLEWRARIAIALSAALLLGFLDWHRHSGRRLPQRLARALHLLGRTSYALFLVHFPVLLLGNALYAMVAQPTPALAWGLLLLCVLVSLALAWVFERRVEAPLNSWFRSRRPA